MIIRQPFRQLCVVAWLVSAMALAVVPSFRVEAGDTASIQARVLPPLAKDIVALIPPIRFAGVNVEGGGEITLSLVDIVYCGNDPRQVPKLLGIVYPGEQPSRPAPALQVEDCHGLPAGILKRIISRSDTPSWVGLLELSVMWKPWQVELTPTKLHGVAKSAHPKIDMRLSPQASQVYPTSFTVPIAGGKALPLHFAMGGVGTAWIVDALVVESPPASFAPKFTHPLNDALPSGTNAIVTMPHALANTILGQYLAGETYAIPVVRSAPALTVKSPSVAGSQDRYLTTSVLGMREFPDAFNLKLEWTGRDLRLAKLAMTARELACGSDVVCQIKRAGADALAGSIGQLLRTQYNGALLRTLILQDVIAVKLSEKEIKIHAEVLRAESSATDLILYTKITFVP